MINPDSASLAAHTSHGDGWGGGRGRGLCNFTKRSHFLATDFS